MEDPLFLDYQHIFNAGNVYVDRISSEPHLVVRITPLSGMEWKDKKDFDAVFSHLTDGSTIKYNITWNGAIVNRKMFGLGWKVEYEQGVSMGTYAVVLDIEDKIQKWKA